MSILDEIVSAVSALPAVTPSGIRTTVYLGRAEKKWIYDNLKTVTKAQPNLHPTLLLEMATRWAVERQKSNLGLPMKHEIEPPTVDYDEVFHEAQRKIQALNPGEA
jgi:hypothetical protein